MQLFYTELSNLTGILGSKLSSWNESRLCTVKRGLTTSSE